MNPPHSDCSGSPAVRRVRVHIAARKLGYSPRSIRRFIKEGRLPAERVGVRIWLLLESDIESFRAGLEAAPW
jgi:excisionase family DNA binding protein